MPLRGELFDPAAGPAPPEWDRFVAEQRLTPAWDAAVLATLAPRHRRLRLGLVHDGGRPLAVFCGQLRGPGLFECKLLPMGSAPGFAFAGGLDPAGRRAAVAAFERALARRLGWRCLAVAYRQVDEADLDACAGRRRPRVATAPDTLLEIRWATMEEYFAGLPSKNRRKKLRQLRRQVASDPDLMVTLGGGVGGEAASRLAFATELRHRRGRLDAPPRPIPPAWFDALAGRDGALFLAWRDAAGSLLAFTLLFDDGERLHSTVWGALDPHRGRSHLLSDQYLRVIAHAVERRRAAVRFGKGELEAKQRFGCVPVPQFAVAAVPQVSRFTSRSGT
jgi:hypothetical protein